MAATRAEARAGATGEKGAEGTQGRGSALFMKEVLRVDTTGVTMICGREDVLARISTRDQVLRGR